MSHLFLRRIVEYLWCKINDVVCFRPLVSDCIFFLEYSLHSACAMLGTDLGELLINLFVEWWRFITGGSKVWFLLTATGICGLRWMESVREDSFLATGGYFQEH